MNENMTDDGVLGKGSVTISEIYSTAPSRCAVADSCSISLDRRLNAAETPQTALAEGRNLPEVIAANAEVSLYTNDDPSYTGLHFPIENYFPSWIISPDAVPCRSMKQAFIEALGREPEIRPWLFSTNGVATALYYLDGSAATRSWEGTGSRASASGRDTPIRRIVPTRRPGKRSSWNAARSTRRCRSSMNPF